MSTDINDEQWLPLRASIIEAIDEACCLTDPQFRGLIDDLMMTILEFFVPRLNPPMEDFQQAVEAVVFAFRTAATDITTVASAADWEGIAKVVSAYTTAREPEFAGPVAPDGMKFVGKPEQLTDGFHTMAELYEQRALYHALMLANDFESEFGAVKSWRHSDGQPCFGIATPGKRWFVVSMVMPDIGDQVTQHYPEVLWGLFTVPKVPTAPVWDKHTSAEGNARMRRYLMEGFTHE